MPRYIDADALRASAIQATGNTELAFDNCFPYWQFSKCIKEATTIDAVPVVRCGECRYRQKAKVNRKGFLICPASGMEITDDDYCSYGAKMEDKP